MDGTGRPPLLSRLGFAVDASGRGLGCLIFEASGALACRNGWIGRTARGRDAELAPVVRNSRFPIFP